MMLKRQQLNLEYKVHQPKEISSFEGIEPINSFQHHSTPGWASLIHTQNNRELRLQQRQDIQRHDVLDKLKQLDDIDLTNSKYTKIRAPQNHNNSILNQKTQNYYNLSQSREKSNKENDSRQIQRSSIHEQSKKKQQTTAMRTESRTQNSLINSNMSYSQKRTGTIIKNTKKLPQKVNNKVQKEKRFKQITVHDHLYLDSKRQETKRLMEQVLDEEYKRQNILTFTPLISQKSQMLAIAKFAQIQERQELESQLIAEAQSLKIDKNSKRNRSKEQFHLDRQQEKYKILNKLFYVLSQNRQIIDKQTVKQVIEELPLACIKMIDNIITKVFQGKEITWLQFLSFVNDKKIVANREALICVADKWLHRLQKKHKEEHETKDETRPYL